MNRFHSPIPRPRILLLAFVIIFICHIPDVSAQRTLGVSWDIPENERTAAEQLQLFNESGISYLEIHEIPRSETWDLMGELGFTVYFRIPIRYPVVQNFARPDSLLITTIRQFIQASAGRNTVEALGLFSYGQTKSRSMPDVVAPYIRQIREHTGLQVYYRTLNVSASPVDSLFDFKLVRMRVDREFKALPDSLFSRGPAFLYHPAEEIASNVIPFKWFLEKSAVNPGAILFMRGDWLTESTSRYPQLKDILAEHAEISDPVFPVPEENLAVPSTPSWIVVILVLVWGAFLLLYNQNPTYRKSLFRYFASHRFFVDDVIQRQIRVLMPGLLVLLLHAVMGGIFLYTLGVELFSEYGVNALIQHYPWISVGGSTHFGLFWFGLLLVLCFEVLCLGWIYFANSRINYFGQMITLYAWPLQINLLVVTAMVTLLKSGILDAYLFPLGIAFLGTLLIAFTLAAFDTERYLRKHNIWFIFGTVGLYSGVLITLFILLITNDYLLNVIRLALSLS